METVLSREFQTRLDLIVDAAAHFWEYKPHHHFIQQGPRHSKRIHRIALDIAGQLPRGYGLSQTEYFALSAASWLYEVGLQPRTSPPVLDFRWDYGEHLSTSKLL